MSRHRPSRPALLSSLLAIAVATSGCGSTPPPKDTRVSTVASSSPGEFGSMRGLLVKLGRLKEAGDAKGARALYGEVLAEGKGLLVMKPPSDLRRDVVPRFLEGRAAFGDALNAYGREQAGTDDAALWTATTRLADSFWAWYDAYRGRPAEGGV